MPDFKAAVAHPRQYRIRKRDALLFDSIYLLGIENNFPYLPADYRSEIETLVGAKVVQDFMVEGPNAVAASDALMLEHLHVSHALALLRVEIEHFRDVERIRSLPTQFFADKLARLGIASYFDIQRFKEICAVVLRNLSMLPNDPAISINNLNMISDDYAVRFATAFLRTTTKVDATPIRIDSATSDNLFIRSEAMTPVLQVILSSLPAPDENTSWESILDFRADEDAQRALRRFRLWLRKVLTDAEKTHHLEDELLQLLDEYQEYMKLHHMKVNKTVFQTLVTIAGEIATGIGHLDFSRVASTVFTLRERTIALMEAERSAPGREVAYIAMARQRFGQKKGA